MQNHIDTHESKIYLWKCQFFSKGKHEIPASYFMVIHKLIVKFLQKGKSQRMDGTILKKMS